MPTYDCYGLTVQSGIDLPELSRARGEADPDITIVEGSLAPRAADAVQVLPGLWRDASSCRLEVNGVAVYEARDGRTVTVDRSPGATDGDLRIFLLGTMLGAVMVQRGHLVLHGNAFRSGDSVAIVVGHSGAGKSTLAAELARRGLDVLSDDVVPIDSRGRALPGYPRIKLWQDALTTLGMETHTFDRIAPSHEKFNVPISRGDVAPLPTHWVYVLEKHDEPTLDLDEVIGVDAFGLLREHTYRRELIFDDPSAWEHLQQCAALADQARIVRVRRPAARMTATATAEAILADVHAHPPTVQEPS